jgi:transcriptional regulator GlxA family with amidase domain
VPLIPNLELAIPGCWRSSIWVVYLSGLNEWIVCCLVFFQEIAVKNASLRKAALFAAFFSSFAVLAQNVNPARAWTELSAPINVAFVLEDKATVIDFAGPWQVFRDVMLNKEGAFFDVANDDFKDIRFPFHLYIVSEKRALITTDSGMRIMPDYTYSDAPLPEIIVVPAEKRESSARDEWLKKVSKNAKVTMSVCTGAYILAGAGLLEGKNATTHHAFQDDFQQRYPKVFVKRGVRFVESGSIATSGGLTSGVDLALRIVQNYFGSKIAHAEAAWLEYKGTDWEQRVVP